METLYPDKLLDFPIPFGADGGYATEGDVLVNVTSDGVDLNVVWAEVNTAISAWNAERSALASLLSYFTTNTADAIPQSATSSSFEEASEYGEPTAIRPGDYELLGYTFKDYDKATRFTWKALRDMSAQQIAASVDFALEADNRLLNGSILERLFSNVAEENSFGHTCYSIYNDDTMVPPEYMGKTFSGTHSHFLLSGQTTIDSGDVEAALNHVREHGYGVMPGSQLICLCNPQEGEVISTFKAGEENQNSVIAKHDYIPSSGAPAFLTSDTIVGQVAPATTANGLKISGSYGPLWVIESEYVPAGYFSVFATYGTNSQNNAIGVREHVNPSYRGLRIIPGIGPYPLQDSFYARSFGVGVRRRGQAAVVQITDGSTYTVPTVAK